MIRKKRGSKYLTVDSIREMGGGPLTCQIVSVELKPIFRPGKGPTEVLNVDLALDDDGRAVTLTANATNENTLIEAFGEETDNWEGETVVVYVDPEVKLGRNTVSGLRISVPRTANVAGEGTL